MNRGPVIDGFPQQLPELQFHLPRLLGLVLGQQPLDFLLVETQAATSSDMVPVNPILERNKTF